MRYAFKITVALIIIGIVAATGMTAVADAQSYSVVRPGGRGGTWEFLLPLIYADSTNIGGQGGSSVNLDADWGFGFGFGYNFNDNFQLNGLMTWNSRSYQATIVQTDGVQRKYNNYVDSSTLSLNGVYYILSGDVTPFVSGGIGLTYVDTNIPQGIGSTSCWWDPWWGYVCGTYVPTKTQNDITYNAGVGVRFDVNRQFSLQGSYNKMWMNISRAQGIPDFDIWRLDFVFRM